jgi:hypothetical protein
MEISLLFKPTDKPPSIERRIFIVELAGKEKL